MRYRSISSRGASRRPGMTLLVVMAMLALFATVALSFVFFADSAFEGAILSRDTVANGGTGGGGGGGSDLPDIDTRVLLGYFLNQCLYDSDNPYSALRGWSLARSIYGNNPGALNHLPYVGVGRSALSYADPVFGVDNSNMINYQKFSDPAKPTDPTVNFDRLPEFYGKPSLVTDASNASPIVITSPGHGLTTGDPVFISGVQGNTAANGAFTITVVDPNKFSLNLTAANGAYASGGTWIHLRAYRAANPPWTAYDTNSLFLAQVDASGNVLMPSYYRPWLETARKLAVPAAQRYMSLRPDPIWNPAFFSPDTDANGLDVKNLDVGPGGNDSRWMDLGFATMTAPNGKRYMPLFAPLIIDLSNRVNLWAHGNRQGAGGITHVSNMGIGAPEVNVIRAIGVPIQAPIPAPGGANAAVGVATITTTRAHGFKVGDPVLIAGVGSPGYDGVFPVTAVPNPLTFQYTNPNPGLAASGNGAVILLSEWMGLFNLKYGGYSGTNAAVPFNAPIAFGRAGAWYSLVDVDGYDPSNGKSTAHLFTGFRTTSANAVTVGVRSMTVPPTGATAGAFAWAFFDVVKVGTKLVVDTGVNSETVTVASVTPATNSFTANFTKAHNPGTGVVFNPYFGYPTYPPGGWNNLTGEQVAGKPLGFNIHYNPPTWNMTTNYAVNAIVYYNGNGLYYQCIQANNTGILPTQTTPAYWTLATNINLGIGTPKGLQMSAFEPLIRYGGTGSNSLPSEVLRRMPSTFSDIRARNMVTLWSSHFDRISAAPFLPFDRTVPPPRYTYDPLLMMTYPKTTGVAPPLPSSTALLANSEYGSDWRSNLGQKLRVNLNRTLANYPGTVGGVIIDSVRYNQAVADRQNFARDIYEALVRVTGAKDPNVVGGMVKTSVEYQASRWLAQLAVNIVDYIDDDDYMTPFNWDTKALAADGWVFGTEQPRLVLNEVYAQHETGPANRVNVWAELLNPLQDTPTPPPPGNGFPINRGLAELEVAGTPAYKIAIHPSSPALTAALRNPANNLGAAPTGPLSAQINWGGNAVTRNVLPSYLADGTTVNGPPVPVTATIKAAAVPGLQEAVNVVTVQTMAPHGFTAGQAVTISGVKDMLGAPVVGYYGTFNITKIIGPMLTSTSFTFAAPVAGLPPAGDGTATVVNNGNAGFYVVGPQGARYGTPARAPNLLATHVSPQMSIATASHIILPKLPAPPGPGASIAGNTVTIHTTAAHGLKKNETVVITGVGVLGYNGTFTIASVPDTKTFTFTVPAALATALAAAGPSGDGRAVAAVPNITLLLRRLANPHRPLNTTPGPLYNPYVTVDYLDGIQVYPNTGDAITFRSFGRSQPYAAYNDPLGYLDPLNRAGSQVLPQTELRPGQPFNTFFTHNSNAATPFTWLTHLDRPLVNQLELLHVSGFRPHELTQQFIRPVGGVATPFQHYAPWNDKDALIYRALEVLGTPNHMAGNYSGGRWAGHINLNTITEPEIFQALCDSLDTQTNPLFSTTDVTTVFQKLVTSRNLALNTPLPVPLNNTLLPTGDGTPFQPFAAGNTDKTWLRPDPTSATGQSLFAVGAAGAHPYGRAALLQKIHNNITTTSNVFAIWWTVGYFEVVDESVRPARLGKELGRDQNRQIRHRFFAIVDRSGMELFNTRSRASSPAAGTPWSNTVPYVVNTDVVSGGIVYRCTKANTGIQPPNAAYWAANSVTVGAAWSSTVPYVVGTNVVYGGQPYRCTKANTGVAPTNAAFWDRVTLAMNFTPPAGAANGVPITIQPGMMLEIGNNEVVSVLTVDNLNNSFTAAFTKSHNANATIVCRGNSGPRPVYDPRQDTNVVLHYSVIQ